MIGVRTTPTAGVYYRRMSDTLSETTALLRRTPAAVDALVRGLPASWTERNEGDSTWSVFDVVGHLIHGDRADWMSRTRTILEFGESKPFEPFDRSGHQREVAGKSMEDLLSAFARVRAEKLAELEALQLRTEDLDRRGRHPVFGVVTLGQLLSTWAAHDLTHLHQISRVMAYQYRDAVGPWIKYLGVLHCQGHGG